MPPSVGDHRDRTAAHRHHFLDAGALGDGRGVEALDLAADHRAVSDRCIEHAGKLQVHAVDLGAVGLVHGVEPGQRFAGDRPVLGVFQSHFARRLEQRRGRGDLAVSCALAAGGVGDHAGDDLAFGGRHAPVGGGGLHQHHPGCGAAFAHIVMRFADAAAAAGREIAPDALACQVLSRRGVFGRDFGPVAL